MIPGPNVSRHQQALDRLIKHQVFIDDHPGIFRLETAVHDAFWIDQHARAKMAGAEAAGVGQRKAGDPQVASRKLIRKCLPDCSTSFFLTGTARVPGRASLNADKDVFLGFGIKGSLSIAKLLQGEYQG